MSIRLRVCVQEHLWQYCLIWISSRPVFRSAFAMDVLFQSMRLRFWLDCSSALCVSVCRVSCSVPRSGPCPWVLELEGVRFWLLAVEGNC